MIRPPEPLTKTPRAPRRFGFGPRERAAWRAVASKLVARRVLTKLDLTMLVLLVNVWVSFEEARAQAAAASSGRERKGLTRLARRRLGRARQLAADFLIIPEERVHLAPLGPDGRDLELSPWFEPSADR